MIIVVIILINLLEFGRSQAPFSCSISNGNYTRNSTYGANLKALLESLSSNMSEYGFYTSSLGLNLQDTAYASALCRGDLTLDQCRTCVDVASHEILQVCPNQREAVLWDDYCTLRYSNNPILGHLTTHPVVGLRNAANASSQDYYFREDVTRLLLDVRIEAAQGGSELKVGAGSQNTSVSGTQIFGLEQCTPDLSSQDCRNCLNNVSFSRRSFKLLDLSCGFRFLGPSCYIRYELYPFYNDTRLSQLQLLLQPPPSASTPLLPPPPSASTPAGKSEGDKTKLVILITLPTCVSLILIASAVIVWRKRMKNTRKQGIIQTADEISSVESLQYDLEIIRAATGDFGDANKLGQGGFGAVYWGKFEDGQEIAAKRLSKDSGQGDIEFKNEVLLVARLQHRNLVRLLGFSLAGTERILVYEFVQNSSLDKFIFDATRRSDLGWDARYKIIGGLARGLLYLHEDSRLRIIHRDLKASNVLLDGDMNPKIADFGMARLFRQDEIQGNTNKIVGTYGYMSPEYAMHGEFSIKSDVFSFGVLILEIISGRRNNLIRRGKNVEDLLTLTWENWRGGTIADIIDPVLRNCSAGSVLRCMHIGLLCVQEKAGNRPTMTSVVSMFNSSTTAMFPQPLEPAFYNASRHGPNDALIEVNDSKSSATLNDMSVSELYPR